jgi:hypothetical protein
LGLVQQPLCHDKTALEFVEKALANATETGVNIRDLWALQILWQQHYNVKHTERQQWEDARTELITILKGNPDHYATQLRQLREVPITDA